MSGSVVAVDLHNDDLQTTNLKEHMQWSDENSEVIEYYGVNKDGNEPKSIQEWLYTGKNGHSVYDCIGDFLSC